jgi:hypothetical protein
MTIKQYFYEDIEELAIGKIHHFGANSIGKERIEFDTEDSKQLDWNSVFDHNGKIFTCFNKVDTDETKMTDIYEPSKNYITHVFVEETFKEKNIT